MPAPIDTPGMIALHLDSMRELPNQPTIQDIFYAYAAVLNTKTALRQLECRLQRLQGGAGGWAGLARIGDAHAMSGLGATEEQVLEDMDACSVLSAEVEAAERRLESLMRRYSEMTGTKLPISEAALDKA